MGSPTMIGLHDDGATIPVAPGGIVELALPESASSGYRWEFDELDESALVVNRASFEAEGAAVGSGGLARWQLRVLGVDRVRLRLKRWRHWEGDASIVQRFEVTLVVQGDRSC